MHQQFCWQPGLRVGKGHRKIVEPGNGETLPIESGFAQEGIVAWFVEVDHDAVILDFHDAAGLDEFAVQLFRRGLLEAAQLFAKPALTAIGQHSQGDIEIDVEPYFAGQTIQMKEIHADAQSILYAISTRVANDEVAGGLFEMVG